jgi:hypothetical protein
MTRSHDSRYTAPADPYAAVRCACGHLIYPDRPHSCRWQLCSCTDHKPKEVNDAAPKE